MTFITKKNAQYWLGYAEGYWQKRILPRLSYRFWAGYLSGLLNRIHN